MPSSEAGIAREADVAKAFPVGTDVEVIVLDVDASGRRIRLSHKAVLDAREAEEVREYTEHADVVSPEGFGSLADKLRGALKPREK
jgi:ribosomal protein S1